MPQARDLTNIDALVYRVTEDLRLQLEELVPPSLHDQMVERIKHRLDVIREAWEEERQDNISIAAEMDSAFSNLEDSVAIIRAEYIDAPDPMPSLPHAAKKKATKKRVSKKLPAKHRHDT